MYTTGKGKTCNDIHGILLEKLLIQYAYEAIKYCTVGTISYKTVYSADSDIN